MGQRKKGQVAMEYLILTALILIGVAIIFAFSFTNYNHNIRLAKANDALAKLGNSVNDIYTRGEGNTRLPVTPFPDGMREIKIVHKCKYGPNQGSLSECEDEFGNQATYKDIEFSAISMKVQLLLGESEIIRETKAKILEDLGELGSQNPSNPQLNKYAGTTIQVRASWTDTDLEGTPLGVWAVKLEKA